MPQFRFSEFLLSTDTGELSRTRQNLELDAKSFQVLSYFCQNPDRIISREELLDNAWPNLVVSDNTINKLIANLRKLLGDDAKKPNFILTVPKKGYRFICPVELVAITNVKTHSSLQQQPEKPAEVPKAQPDTETTGSTNKYLVPFLLLLFSASFIWMISGGGSNNNSDIETLTRMEGDKGSVLVSRNGKEMMFINRLGHETQLWHHTPGQQKLTRVAHSFERIEQLVYFSQQDHLYLLVKSNGDTKLVKAALALEDAKLNIISTLPATLNDWRILDIGFHAYSETFYLVGYNKVSLQQGLFKLNAQSDSQQQNQLQLINVGLDIQSQLTRLDISPDQKKLLLLAKNKDNSTKLLSFDIATQQASNYKKFAGLIRNAIWHHNSEGVYYNDTPPAQRVISLVSANAKPAVVASSSEYLCCEVTRLPDGKNLIYRTNIRNFSIETQGSKGFEVVNSPIYDMMPALFHQRQALAFISKRSGESQLYIQLPQQQPQQISSLTSYKVINSVDISADNSAILLAEGNRLILYRLNWSQNTAKLQNKQEHRLELNIVAAHWLDSNHFAVSLWDKSRRGKQTRIQIYNRQFQLVRELESIWHGLYFDTASPNLAYLLNDDFKLHSVDLQQLLNNQPLALTTIKQLPGSRLRDIKISEQQLYQRIGRKLNIQPLATDSATIETIAVGRSYGFDVAMDTIAVSKLKYASSDLHMTRFK